MKWLWDNVSRTRYREMSRPNDSETLSRNELNDDTTIMASTALTAKEENNNNNDDILNNLLKLQKEKSPRYEKTLLSS